METRGANEASSKATAWNRKNYNCWWLNWPLELILMVPLWVLLSDNPYIHIIYPPIQKYYTFSITWRKSIECLHDWLKTPFAAGEPSHGGNCKFSNCLCDPSTPTAASTGMSASWSWVTQSAAKGSKPSHPAELQHGFWSDGLFAQLCTLLTPAGADGWMTGWLGWWGCSGPGTVPGTDWRALHRDLHYYSNLHILIPSEFPSSTFIRRWNIRLRPCVCSLH